MVYLQGSLAVSFWYQAKKGIYSGLRVTLFQEKIVSGYSGMKLLNFLAERILTKKPQSLENGSEKTR